MRRASLVPETKKSEKYPPPPLEPYLQALAEPVALFSPALAEALGLPMPPGAFFEENEDATIDEVRSALMEMKVGAPPQRPPLALNTAAARRVSSPPADDPGLKAKPRKGSLTTVAPAAESPRSRVHIDYSPWVSPAPSPRELPTQQPPPPPPPQSDRTATSRGGRSGGGLTSGGRGGAIRRPPAAPSTASGAASQRGSAPSSPRQRSASFGGAIGSSVVFSGSKSPSSPRLSGGGAARPGPLIPKGRSPKSEDDGAREEQPEQQPAQQRRPSPSLHAVSLLFAPYRSPSASQACTPAQSPWQSPRAERSKEEPKEEPKRKKFDKEEPIFLETADV